MFFIQYYLLAMIIGAIISFPIGPLGLLCVQRSIRKGFFQGFISGFGAALSDLTYGIIVLFSFDFIDQFIHKDNKYISLILAGVFFLLGVKLLRSKDLHLQDEFIHPAISAYFIGLSNMGTVIIYLAIFTYFPKDLGLENFYFSIITLFFIFLGALLFWFFTCETVSKFNKYLKVHHFVIIDKVIGLVILIFASLNLIRFTSKFIRSIL